MKYRSLEFGATGLRNCLRLKVRISSFLEKFQIFEGNDRRQNCVNYVQPLYLNGLGFSEQFGLRIALLRAQVLNLKT
jgi:hypothetical protein